MKRMMTFVMLVGVLLGGQAWGQQRTVMYKDWQQTVTVAHIFSPPVIGPPFTVVANGLGQVATGLAADMVGASTVAGLGAATPALKVRQLTDGGAAGALAVSDGTDWDCAESKASRVYIVTCPPYNAKGDGVTNDSAALAAAIGTGNRTVLLPPGTYIAAGLLWKSNLRLLGSGMGVTILKLPNATQNSVTGSAITPLTNVEIAYMTIDGNAVNQTNPNYAAVGINGITNFQMHHVEIKNSIEYCMGIEHGINTGKLSDMVVGPCRWDGIDIKNTANQTRFEIVNVSVDSPGSDFGDGPVTNSVCIDSGGRNRLSNVRCKGLKGQTYGFSFRRHQTGPGTNCDVSFCEGGDGSSLNNFIVEGDGTTTTYGAGVLVRDDYIQVNNGYISGMGRGVYVESDPGVGSASYVMVNNVIVLGSLTTSFATDTTALYTSFVNCSSIDSKGNGAEFSAGSVRFVGSAVTNAAGHGIVLGGTSQHIKIEGSTITLNTGYGIYIGPGIANSLIVGNTILANGDDIADGGAATIIQNNYGVKTANNAQVILPAGATSVVVSHGLDWSPDASGISLTALGAPTTPVGVIYVDPATVTATQFTIKSQTAPGGGGLAIGWRAIEKY